jgi:hypothetical protein
MDIFCREVKPFVSLTIQEIQFWLGIMREHAAFIYLGLPNDQEGLKQEAQQLENVFDHLEKQACLIRGGEDFSWLVAMSVTAVKNLFAFKRQVLQLLIECRICGSCLYPLSIDHMSREAMYFLKLLQKIADGDMRCQVDAITGEDVFWLRVMSEHLNFGQSLLDPSSRKLSAELCQFGDKYERFGLQARGLATMLWHFRPTEGLVRFQKDLTETTIRLGKFTAAIEARIEECGVVSAISPLLANHICRETGHFIDVLELIRQNLVNGDTAICCYDYDA